MKLIVTHLSVHIVTIFLVCVVGMLIQVSPSKFQVNNTVLTAIVTMLCILQNLLITGGLYPLTNIFPWYIIYFACLDKV